MTANWSNGKTFNSTSNSLSHQVKFERKTEPLAQSPLGDLLKALMNTAPNAQL